MKPLTISAEELARYREETKGSNHVIHLNNAGTSLPPNKVVDVMVDYLKDEALHGGYETEHKHIAQLENVYELIAQIMQIIKDSRRYISGHSFS